MAKLWLPPADLDPAALWGPGACSTPIRFVVDSGLRPVVVATVDGVDATMLVHANAGFLAMLTHDALYRVAGRRVPNERAFGLGHDLLLSAAGRGHTNLETLTVAGRTLSGVRFEVFDLPTINWEGMLGVEWLSATGAVVDFGRARLTIPRDTAVPALAIPGVPTVDLRRDESTGRYMCGLSIDVQVGNPGRFVVSTVAETTLDIEYARALGIDLGEPVGDEHGPAGAVVPTYRPSEPMRFFADGHPLAAVRPTIYDIYAYGGNERPGDGTCIDGYLGADVLLETRAVVSFGDRT